MSREHLVKATVPKCFANFKRAAYSERLISFRLCMVVSTVSKMLQSVASTPTQGLEDTCNSSYMTLPL